MMELDGPAELSDSDSYVEREIRELCRIFQLKDEMKYVSGMLY